MAISFVGGKTFNHNGQLSASPQSVALTDLKDESGNDATLQEGDVVFVWVIHSEDSLLTAAELACMDASATPYDTLHPALFADDSYDVNALLQARQIGATPDTSVTVPAVTDDRRGLAVAIVALRGLDYANLTAVTPVTNTGSDGGIPDPGSITPTEPGSWIMACGGCADNWNYSSLAALTLPPGMSGAANHFQSAVEAGRNYWENGCCAAIALKTDWTGGAYDPPSFGGGSPRSAAARAAVSLAIPPLAAGGGDITGAASINETQDALASNGQIGISGAASVVETGDTAASSGKLAISGAALAAEASDALTAASSSRISGAASAIASDDLLASIGETRISGTAGVWTDDDRTIATGGLAILGEASVAEAGDTAAAISEQSAVGTATVLVEASDALAAAGRLRLTGLAALPQAGDISAGTGRLAVGGVLAIAEAGDTARTAPRNAGLPSAGRILRVGPARQAGRIARFGSSRLAGRTLSFQE